MINSDVNLSEEEKSQRIEEVYFDINNVREFSL